MATHSGVVGEENTKYRGPSASPKFDYIAREDVALAGMNYETKDEPMAPGLPAAGTGAFVPFGWTAITRSSSGSQWAAGVRARGWVSTYDRRVQSFTKH